MKNLIKLGRDFLYISQLGLSIITPIVLCVWLGRFLEKKFMLGGWAVFLGIFLGLGGSVSSIIGFYKYAMKK